MTPPAIALRPTTLADVALLAALHAEGPDEPWSTDAFARLLVLPGTVGRIAVVTTAQRNEPAGFVLARSAGGEAEILTINVARARRRQGIGLALMRAVVAADLHDATRLVLEVAAGNAPAQALYRAIGFAPVGRRIGYYGRADGSREDALIMAVALGAECANDSRIAQSTITCPKG
ncbi:MAG: GNAT family N-acetyltransferase [Alphaproteobacteria bacterium]|nr:GNAT family N-acetyltransferase [Alphaproteobacteria bacterium]